MNLFSWIATKISVGHPRHDAVEVGGVPSLAALLEHNRTIARDTLLNGGRRRGWMDSWREPRQL